MSYVVRFLRFWIDFVVGDDWRVAAGLVAALGVSALLVAVGLDPWWLLPAAVAGLLGDSLRRARSASSREPD